MKLNELAPAPGSKTKRRRVGRGIGSGSGKTAGRGQKGQKSRSGFSQSPGWEGGQSRLIERLPKRGFNRYRIPSQVVNLRDLNRFADGETVSAETLHQKGVIRHENRPVKLLGKGLLEVKNLSVNVTACSASAHAAVTAQGGTVTVQTGADN
ncbi:MAG: 50S ribosomal protein L15 [Deinococcota bacterium]